jgi:sugar lactone lactonase YvrE
LGAILAFACALLLGGGQAAASTPHDLTGTWSCCGPGGAAAQTWTISAMDKASGNFSGTGLGGSIKMDITGNANGDAVTLTTAYTGSSYSATFKGTLSADSKTMSGSWESTSSQNGTWTATRPSAPTPGDPNAPDPNAPEGTKAKAIPGDIYLIDSAVNNGLGALYKVNPESGQPSIVHAGPPFSGVRGLAFGPEGNLFLTDIGAHAILKLDLKSGAVTRVTAVNEPLLGAPWGIVYEPEIGDFLVTDSVQGTVVRVDPKTGVVKRLYQNNGGAPHGIALEPGGPAYIADQKFRGVLKLARSGGSDWNVSVFKKGPFLAPEGIAPVPTPTGTRFYVTDTAAPGGSSGATAPGGSGGLFSWLGSAAPEVLFTPKTSGGVLQIPTTLAQSSDGKTLFIGSNDGLIGKGAIVAMNLADGKLRTLAGGFSLPSGIAVAPPKRVEVKVDTSGKSTTANPNGVTTTVTSPQQPVAATVGVVVNVPGGFRPGAGASKAIQVKAVTKTVPAGKRGAKIRVPFPAALRRSIKAAQRAGKKVKAKLKIGVTAGNGSSRKFVKRVLIKPAG